MWHSDEHVETVLLFVSISCAGHRGVNLEYFTRDKCVHPSNLLPDFPFRATRGLQSFRFWLCSVQVDFWGVKHIAESDSAARCTQRSLTQRRDAHRGVWLSGKMHTAESDSAVRRTPQSLTLQRDAQCTPLSLTQRWDAHREVWNGIKTILSRLTGIHMGSNY